VQVPFQNIIYVENLKDKEMEYISWFVGWFLQNFTSENISLIQLMLTLGLSCMNAVYLFGVYHMLSRKTFYSKRYNIMLASMVLIITAIIFTVQSDVVLSLGMVGALSIVRFRTAIKDALDIVFLFWAVTAGICYGAHMAEIAIMLSALVTILIFVLDSVSTKRGYRLLIVEMARQEEEKEVLGQLRELCKYIKVKTRISDENKHKIVAEIKVREEFLLIQSLEKMAQITSISLISHEGENTY